MLNTVVTREQSVKPSFAFAGEAAHRRIPSAAAVTSGLRAR